MRRLLASELLRFRSRRLVVMLVGTSWRRVGLVIAAWQSTPPTEEIREQRGRGGRAIPACMNDFEGEDVEGSLEEFCRENAGTPPLHAVAPRARRSPADPEGISSITSILGLVIGASFVAASWQTGTISTIFTWEPRRLRWFASRISVLTIGVFVTTALILAFLSGGVALAATLRGSTPVSTVRGGPTC